MTFRTLPSGYVLIRGRGPCNWAQPPRWPCTRDELSGSVFPEAGEEFIAELERLCIKEEEA